ncbi:MAG: DUF4339 domain-containing protein, partial [Verrucomicrobiae bacterium]|nr:DUF4339 domain-containing protein [Verrucomicrobiae bacterium]
MPLYYLDSTQNTCELREEDILPAIESGLLRDDTFVWREGMADWVPFENLKPEFMPDVSPPEDPAAGEDIGFHTGSPVWEILNREIFLVKKALDASADSANFDIFEPEMGALILECREVAHQKRRSFLSENSSFDIALHLPHGGIQVCRIAGESSRFFGRTKSRIRIFNERNLEIASVVPGHGKPDLVSLFATDDQRRLVSV